jgi:ATP-dependent Clp protease ATP-binding subunit ClpA
VKVTIQSMARPLKRFLQRQIETALSRKMLAGKYQITTG